MVHLTSSMRLNWAALSKACINDSDAKQKIELFQNIIMRIMGVVAGAEMDPKFDLESITVQIEH